MTAGSTETVGIWIHEDEAPYPADGVEVVFSRVGDGTTIRAVAEPTELVGRWEATVELPAGGTWAVAAEVTGPDYAGVHTMDALQVQPPAAPAGAAPATPIPVMPWLGLLVLAAVVAGIGGLTAMTRRRQAPVQG
jgi:hypothetical protein